MLSKQKNLFIIGFLFLFFLVSLFIFKPFMIGKEKKNSYAVLISPTDFPNYLWGKPFLYNAVENASEKIFKQEVEQQARLYPQHFFLEKTNRAKSPRVKKQIALTFDDSPDDWYCPQVLGILEKYQVKATFFLIANRLKTYRHNAEEIKKQGHLIGNHSFSHKKFTLMTTEQMLLDLDSSEIAFEQILQLKPKFFRPPYGVMTNEQISALIPHQYKIINWSVDTYDWDIRRNSPLDLFMRVEQYAHNGAIILLHSSGKDRENTIQALPMMIRSLQERDFEFVRLDEWF